MPSHARFGDYSEMVRRMRIASVTQLFTALEFEPMEVVMKRVLLFVLLSGVALAAAGQTQPSQSVEVRGSQFQLPAQPYPAVQRDLAEYTGAYHLSNGERRSSSAGFSKRRICIRNAFPCAIRRL